MHSIGKLSSPNALLKLKARSIEASVSEVVRCMRSPRPSSATVVSIGILAVEVTRRLFAGELDGSSSGGSRPERDRFTNGVEEAMLLILDAQT